MLRCKACYGIFEKKLKAINPFDVKLFIYGCPLCKSVVEFDEVCTVDGCHNVAGRSEVYGGEKRLICGDHL